MSEAKFRRSEAAINRNSGTRTVFPQLPRATPMALAFKRSQAEIAALVTKEENHLQSVFGKKVTVEVDYESIKQFTGNAGSSSVTKVNLSPSPLSKRLLHQQESLFKGIKCWILKDSEGQGLCGTLKYTIGKDQFGKEAFLETFDKIKVTVHQLFLSVAHARVSSSSFLAMKRPPLQRMARPWWSRLLRSLIMSMAVPTLPGVPRLPSVRRLRSSCEKARFLDRELISTLVPRTI